MPGGLQHHQTLWTTTFLHLSRLWRGLCDLFLDDFGFALTARVFGRVLRLAGQAFLLIPAVLTFFFDAVEEEVTDAAACSAFGVSAASGDAGVFAV